MSGSSGYKWKPGQSGNPAGRPKGTGKFEPLRAAISEHVPEIISKLASQAREGDVGAARLLLERVYPALKPMEANQEVDLPEGSLTDQGKAVLAAVATGSLAPSQGAALISAIGSLAKVSEIDELARRIEALEAKESTHAKT